MSDSSSLRYVPYGLIVMFFAIFYFKDTIKTFINPNILIWLWYVPIILAMLIAARTQDYYPVMYILSLFLAFTIVFFSSFLILQKETLTQEELNPFLPYAFVLSLVFFYLWANLKKILDYYNQRNKCQVCGRKNAIYSLMRRNKKIRLCYNHMSSKFKELFLQCKGKLILFYPKLEGMKGDFVYQFFNEKEQKFFRNPDLNKFVQANLEKLHEKRQIVYYDSKKIIYKKDAGGLMMPDFIKIDINPEYVQLEGAIERVQGYLTDKKILQPIVIPEIEENGIMFVSEI